MWSNRLCLPLLLPLLLLLLQARRQHWLLPQQHVQKCLTAFMTIFVLLLLLLLQVR
jgi:hypothetical protein